MNARARSQLKAELKQTKANEAKINIHNWAYYNYREKFEAAWENKIRMKPYKKRDWTIKTARRTLALLLKPYQK